MALEAFTFPAEAIRCRRGDYILQRRDDNRVRVCRVQALVALSRLVPFGDDALVAERDIVDSERPAFKEEIHLLLLDFEREFASFEEATRAVDAGDLGAATEGRCLDIRRFPAAVSQVYRAGAGGPA